MPFRRRQFARNAFPYLLRRRTELRSRRARNNAQGVLVSPAKGARLQTVFSVRLRKTSKRKEKKTAYLRLRLSQRRRDPRQNARRRVLLLTNVNESRQIISKTVPNRTPPRFARIPRRAAVAGRFHSHEIIVVQGRTENENFSVELTQNS